MGRRNQRWKRNRKVKGGRIQFPMSRFPVDDLPTILESGPFDHFLVNYQKDRGPVLRFQYTPTASVRAQSHRVRWETAVALLKENSLTAGVRYDDGKHRWYVRPVYQDPEDRRAAAEVHPALQAGV